jgi:hypothetical protein
MPPLWALTITLEGLGALIIAVLGGLAFIIVAVRGVRIHIDRKER